MANNISAPRVSVLTPSWNRAGYLERVWRGLMSQTFVGFEWIVANDGSSDETVAVVADLAARSTFPVKLLNASVRVGKSCMDNLLVQEASGEFVIWCDSDDMLFPDALDVLIDAWEAVPADSRDGYMGVTARARTEDGLLGKPMPPAADGWSWNDIYAALQADLVMLARADLLKKTPFLEVDYLIPETSVWNVIGVRKSRFVDKALKLVFYNQPLALSFGGRMQYNRGRAYALARNYQYVKGRIGLKGELFRAVNYIRYCFHGEVSPRRAISMWTGSMRSHVLLFVGVIPAVFLVMRDLRRGVVDKTHRAFGEARRNVRVERTVWGK